VIVHAIDISGDTCIGSDIGSSTIGIYRSGGIGGWRYRIVVCALISL